MDDIPGGLLPRRREHLWLERERRRSHTSWWRTGTLDRSDFPVVAEELVALGGRSSSPPTETRGAREWANRQRAAREPIPTRLRLAIQVALLVERGDDAGVAQAWLQDLKFTSMTVPRPGSSGWRTGRGRALVLSAARAFHRRGVTRRQP